MIKCTGLLTKLIVAQNVFCRSAIKLSGFVLAMLLVGGIVGCDEHRTDCPTEVVTVAMFPEEMRMLHDLFGCDYVFEDEDLRGTRFLRPASGEGCYITWVDKRNADMPVMWWTGAGVHVQSIHLRYLLGRKYHVMDDGGGSELEQSIDVTVMMREKVIRWSIPPPVAGDDVLNQTDVCLRQTWKLNSQNNPNIYCWCPFDKHAEFSEILAQALSINGIKKPFRVGGIIPKK